MKARSYGFAICLKRYDLSVQILATVNAIFKVKGLLLTQGKVVDATRIAAPNSTKKSTGNRGPEMHQARKDQ